MKMTPTPNSTRIGFPRKFILIGLIGLATAAQLLAAAPEARTVTLTDYLGVDWKDELVHFAIELPKGALKGAATAEVKAADGKAVPCQAGEVVTHDDGSIRSFNVWFLVDLPANQSASFTISPGKRGPDDDGVTVKASEASIEFTTKAPQKIGIRLLGGAKEFTPPVPATGVPGPISALLLPSGRETGQGRFQVPFPVKSYKAEVTAAGPVFAEARIRYQFDVGYWTLTARVIRRCPTVIVREEFDTGRSPQSWSQYDRFYSLVLNGGEFKPTQVFYGGRNDHAELQTLLKDAFREDWRKLSKGLETQWIAVTLQGYTPTFQADRDDYYLTGYPTTQNRVNTMIRLLEPGKDALGFVGLQTAEWRNPLSLRFRTNRKGEFLASLPLQMYEQGWASDGFGGKSQNYTGKTTGVPENTGRRCYGIMLSPAEDEGVNMLSSLFAAGEKLGAHPLDRVKEMLLDWSDPMAGAAWAAETSKAGADALRLMRDKVRYARAVGNYGRISMAYHYGFAKKEYPSLQAVLDSPKDLTAADRKEFRRLCAWLAYDMNSVDTFPMGCGFHLGNPNMTIMAIEGRLKAALLVKDHPRFRAWGEENLGLLRDFIRRYTRDSGAPYENPHYTLAVTLDWAAQANTILMENGIGDAFDTDLFRKSLRCVMNWLTPPDPRFLAHRMVMPYGNCSYQSVPPTLATQMVTYLKERQPELAAQFQWFANQTLPDDKKILIAAKDLPPPLASVHYADHGVFFRHGFGTPWETFFFMMAGNCDGHYEWEADQMTYTLYAKGQPINLNFGNGYFPMFCRPWLRNRVTIDHKYEVTERNTTGVRATAFSPAADYLRAERTVDMIRSLATEYPVLNDKKLSWASAEQKSWPTVPDNVETIPPVTWSRQVMFLKDEDPKGPNYFVIRDGFGGTPTRPTDVSYWFLANKMERNGNVFHFDGQCEVDMDVFVHTPAIFEPETGEYGHPQQPYGSLVGFDPKFYPGGVRAEQQLFLRVKQPAGKGYMVVLYPRLKENDPAASFTALADGVVRVETPLSTDYAFLNPAAFEFKDNRVQFSGMSGTVRFYKTGKIAVANTEGKLEVRVAGRRIEGAGPFTATIEGGKVATQTHAPDARVDAK